MGQAAEGPALILETVAGDGDVVLDPLVLADQLGANGGALDPAASGLELLLAVHQPVDAIPRIVRKSAVGQLLNPPGQPGNQELAYGGLSDNAQDRINQLMRSKGELEPANRRVRRPAVGTKLIREYQGVEHHVTVTRNGFEYQGRTFGSLSHIAREITGTRWSGPLFFGLTRTRR